MPDLPPTAIVRIVRENVESIRAEHTVANRERGGATSVTTRMEVSTSDVG